MSDTLNPNGPAPEGGAPQGSEPSGGNGNWTDSVAKDLVDAHGERLGQFGSYRDFVEGSVNAMGELESYKSRFDGRVVAPTEQDTGDTWSQFWKQMGRPEDASGYGIEEESLSSIFHEANLTKSQAEQLTKGLVGYNEQAEQSAQEARQAAYESAVSSMKEKYQDEFEAKMVTANTALTNLGGEALVKTIHDKGLDNDPDMIEFFINLGSMMQEGNIPAGQAGRPTKEGLVGTYDSMKGID